MSRATGGAVLEIQEMNFQEMKRRNRGKIAERHADEDIREGDDARVAG
jgi:hypothetical protein